MSPSRSLIAAVERVAIASVGVTADAVGSATPGLDLTLPQWRVLVLLGQLGELRVGDLAARLAISLPSASRLARRLERRGLIASARDESDRRAILLSLSPEGRRTRSRVMAARRSRIRRSLARHAIDGDAAVETSLQEIADALEAEG